MKTIIVTGAAGNLGSEIVRSFLQQGDRVAAFVHAKSDKPDMGYGEYTQWEVDLRDEAAVDASVQQVIAKYKTVDAAILTAGGFAMGDLSNTGSAFIRDQMALNFETAYHVVRPVYAHMKQKGSGRIFLVGSKAGENIRQGKQVVAYALAKSLLFRLAELLNEEAKGTDVVTTVIVPSTIDTPANRAAMPAADPGNWVKPVAIAEIIRFHTSAAADPIREPVVRIYNNA